MTLKEDCEAATIRSAAFLLRPLIEEHGWKVVLLALRNAVGFKPSKRSEQNVLPLQIGYPNEKNLSLRCTVRK